MSDADLSRLPALPPRTILQVEVGSTAHGTGLPGKEDLDVAAVYVEKMEEVFNPLREKTKNVMQQTAGLGNKSGPDDIDRTIYPLRNFLNLCLGGNPSVMLALWAPVLGSNGFGRQLRTLAPKFIARSMIPRYKGYMLSEMKKLEENPFGQRPELEGELPYDTKAAMHAVRLGFQCVELLREGSLTLPVKDSAGELLRGIRRGDYPFETVQSHIDELEKSLDFLYADESLPEHPDVETVTKFSIHVHSTNFEGI